jgi:glycerol-3-phosphate dehydrogenase
MKRDLSRLQGEPFDVVIIGGGIYGVCTAWDAALRGLSVVLIEKGDFGGATSSNSLKIIHGGLRYLQHADFKRMRESIVERGHLMRIAPHLVHPLPCVMPTYGHALKSKEVMAVALLINDLIGFDRNRIARSQHIPNGRVISKKEILDIVPGLAETGLTGGAVWYDCQVANSERMLLSILHSAVAAGAVAANYVEMVGLQKNGDRVTGVKVRDTMSGDEFVIQSKLAINNSGPWVNSILHNLNGRYVQPQIGLSAAMNLVVKRKIFSKYAVGLWSKKQFKDTDAVVSKGGRLFFITPWKDYTLVGTTHVHYEGAPGDFKIRESDIVNFMNEVNDAYPPANLKREDVSFFYGGLLPSDGVNPQTGDVKLLKTYRIVDHQIENGLEGMISIYGVKYTTARDVAEKTVDYVFKKFGMTAPACQTSSRPVYGGNVENYEEFLRVEKGKSSKLGKDVIEQLISNHGSAYRKIVRYAEENSELAERVLPSSKTIKAEVIHAVRDEMALKLSDVVRRRTELGSAECPADAALKTCAQLMAAELGWNAARIQKEIEETKKIYVPAQ